MTPGTARSFANRDGTGCRQHYFMTWRKHLLVLDGPTGGSGGIVDRLRVPSAGPLMNSGPILLQTRSAHFFCSKTPEQQRGLKRTSYAQRLSEQWEQRQESQPTPADSARRQHSSRQGRTLLANRRASCSSPGMLNAAGSLRLIFWELQHFRPPGGWSCGPPGGRNSLSGGREDRTCVHTPFFKI